LGFYHPKTKKKPRTATASDSDGEVRLQDPRPEKKKTNKQTVGLRRDPARSGEASAGEIRRGECRRDPALFLLLSLFFFLLPSSFSFLSSLIGCCMVQNGFVLFFFSPS
jgi:hypothetical protein